MNGPTHHRTASQILCALLSMFSVTYTHSIIWDVCSVYPGVFFVHSEQILWKIFKLLTSAVLVALLSIISRGGGFLFKSHNQIKLRPGGGWIDISVSRQPSRGELVSVKLSDMCMCVCLWISIVHSHQKHKSSAASQINRQAASKPVHEADLSPTIHSVFLRVLYRTIYVVVVGPWN